ncbi:cation-translocating P-type ATPase [Pararhizobium antarcticum]|uniref:HAD family hydrolase n=1 Tax=Pararhizobium antarcticum TaxID=1798805 RepID=A0A657LVN0_9HYPH|nr:cation-translocating P-type ATPase [Pararhizobium antarcticum]OJF95694.1 HAD family hydrolase [Rhizobium sp. 58]OJF99414.1 HAD family hydrolase [Pararhizobium antarcticum]
MNRAAATPATQDDWYNRSNDEVHKLLGVSLAGLSSPEAASRLVRNGPNEISSGERISVLQIFISQFRSLIIWVLICAAVISALVGETVNVIAIMAVIILNAALGFYQEYSAEKSVAALKLMTAPQAKVRRDGHALTVPASEVVVGDILMLAAGDLVAADARLCDAATLQMIEATLTGESETVAKQAGALTAGNLSIGDQTNMVFMGTSVAKGTGRAIIIATGMATELGQIAGLIEKAGSDKGTPLQKKLDAFGRILVWAALGIVAVLFGLGLLRGTALYELALTAISLAVAAVPESLPAVVTVALSVGVMQMARRRVLVRKLAAVETLGSTTVICTDKTGTLTVGEMTVRRLYVAGQSYDVTGEGYGPAGAILLNGNAVSGSDHASLLALAAIHLGCNNAHLREEAGIWKTIGDPTEGALLTSAAKARLERKSFEQQYPKHFEIPFDSDRKRSTVVRRMPDGHLRALVNGAPGPLLEKCTLIDTGTGVQPISQQDRTDVLAEISAMANRALRVLGSAYRDLDGSKTGQSAEELEHDLVFVGLAGMYDPPRPEARQAIAQCRMAGLRIVMITGDHPDTATAIARDIGIASDRPALTGSELQDIPDKDLQERAAKTSVYARVTAAHKLRIVHALKANGDVVAMTGDGVNDAPAIKGADIGIAMGQSGTEVTKQAADLIITDDNFATIVDAIKQGRGIYDNIRKTLQYLLAGSTAELLLMAVCVVIGVPTPLLPIHLLWINLVTDGLPALCLATDAIDSDVMERPPRLPGEPITDRGFLSTMLFTGCLTAAVAFAVFLYMLDTTDTETARTYAFTVMVFSEVLRAFGARSESRPVWRISVLTNRNLLIVVGVSFGIQVLSQHNAVLGDLLKSSPVPFTDCLVLLALSTIPSIVLELGKLWRQRR